MSDEFSTEEEAVACGGLLVFALPTVIVALNFVIQQGLSFVPISVSGWIGQFLGWMVITLILLVAIAIAESDDSDTAPTADELDGS